MSNIICVLGHNGQLATSLYALSQKMGIETVCVGRAECDLNYTDRLVPMLESIKPTGIINAAAYTDVEMAETAVWSAMNVNAVAVQSAASYCIRNDIPMVQVSTDYTYDGEKGHPYLEEDHCRPLNVYGFSKLVGDHAILDSNVRGTVLRTSWVFSPFNRNFVSTMTNLALTRDVVRVVNDQYGNPTDARDLAAASLATLQALQAGKVLPRLMHFGGAPSVTWADLAEATFAAVKTRRGFRPRLERITSAEYPSKVLRPKDTRLDTTLFTSQLFSINTDWRLSVQDCVEQILDRMSPD